MPGHFLLYTEFDQGLLQQLPAVIKMSFLLLIVHFYKELNWRVLEYLHSAVLSIKLLA